MPKTKGLSFEELLTRFQERVNSIPAECVPAVQHFLYFKVIQRERLKLENRIRQTERLHRKVFWADGIPEEFQLPMKTVETAAESLQKEESRLNRQIGKLIKKTRWYQEVAEAAAEGEGMGPIIACDLLWQIGSASRFSSFGKIVKYCGLHVVDGAAPSCAPGKKGYKPTLLSTLGNLATLAWWTKEDGVWRARWDAFIAIEREKHPEPVKITETRTKYSDEHIKAMARRKTQREFMRNLYTLWIEYEKRNTPQPEPEKPKTKRKKRETAAA